jgi:ABC-type multidrug transport system ATPase subunit
LEPILEVRGLTKSFKKFRAVDDLSFTIQRGEVYGFLGQNGAGKSTTMRMVLGLIFPDSGSIFIDGKEFNNDRRYLLKNVGAIIERPDLYGYLSGWDNLRMFASLTGKQIGDERIDEVLTIVGLKGREKDKVGAYSQGMKQRMGIAIAMVHDPELLILDEPTNGLDPQGIADMRSLIRSLSKDHGKTVLVSSHLLYEIEQVASSMLIIHKGKKVSDGKVSELLHPDDTLTEIQFEFNADIRTAIMGSEWAGRIVNVDEEQMTVKMNPAGIPALNNWLVAHGAGITGISSKHSFEQYFLSITDDSVIKDRAI